MRVLVLVLLLFALPCGAEPVAPSADWSARQTWSSQGPLTALEAGGALGLPWWSGTWASAVLGAELAATTEGSFRSFGAFAGLRWGLEFSEGDLGLRPWVGTRVTPFAPEAGLEATLKLWGRYVLVWGAGWSGGWSLSLGTRVLGPITVVATVPLVLEGQVSPARFTPGDGVDVLKLAFRVVSGPPVQRWSWQLTTPEGRLFLRASGAGTLPSPLLWDGQAPDGTLPFSLAEYRLMVTVEGGGVRGQKEVSLRTGVIVETVGTRSVVRLSALPSGEDLALLVQLLRARGASTLVVSAHTNPANRSDATLALEEDRTVGQPLTLQRALDLRDALIGAGWSPEALRVEGVGSRRPLVPADDAALAWKNRRWEISWDRAAR